MNFLSHHRVARLAVPDAPDALFIGNVLPDLISVSGDGRLRQKHVAQAAPGDPLAAGVRLHLATDRRFHGHPRFAELMAEASALLRAAPLSEPPKRVFFLAHVAVEIALDARALARDPGVADSLYDVLGRCDGAALVVATQAMLGAPEPPPKLAAALARFVASQHLRRSADGAGRVDSLHRLARVAGLPGFPNAADRRALDAVFDALLPTVSVHEDELWTPPGKA